MMILTKLSIHNYIQIIYRYKNFKENIKEVITNIII